MTLNEKLDEIFGEWWLRSVFSSSERGRVRNRSSSLQDSISKRRFIGSVHKFVRFFLTLPNNLFFTQIIKQSINYVFSSIIHDCLPTFGQVLDPTLQKIRRVVRGVVVEPILEFSVDVEENSAQIVGERKRAEEVVIRWARSGE
jgi:hypothetical protein